MLVMIRLLERFARIEQLIERTVRFGRLLWQKPGQSMKKSEELKTIFLPSDNPQNRLQLQLKNTTSGWFVTKLIALKLEFRQLLFHN